MAQDTAFTEAQQQELQTNLVAALRADTGLKETFCKCWPCAKDVLQILLNIPGLPAIVATVIKGIVKAGDFAFGTVCK